jgi:hypothetical protein
LLNWVRCLLEGADSLVILGLLAVVLRVLAGVMSEIKAFWLVDRGANPPREVSIAQLASPFGVFVLDELLEVVVVDLEVATQVPHEVLDCDEAIVVRVEGQEGFLHFLETVLELLLNHFLQFEHFGFKDLGLVMLVGLEFGFLEDNVPLFVALGLFLHEVEVREEHLLEHVEGQRARGNPETVPLDCVPTRRENIADLEHELHVVFLNSLLGGHLGHNGACQDVLREDVPAPWEVKLSPSLFGASVDTLEELTSGSFDHVGEMVLAEVLSVEWPLAVVFFAQDSAFSRAVGLVGGGQGGALGGGLRLGFGRLGVLFDHLPELLAHFGPGGAIR